MGLYSGRPRLDAGYLAACRRTGTRPTRHVLEVCLLKQKVRWWERRREALFPRVEDFALRRQMTASSSRFGVGQIAGSNRTPLGLHAVAEKVGAGHLIGAAFTNRLLAGHVWNGRPHAPIAHRILWLEGLDPGFNRGGKVDTFSRYIYIHGLADEPTLGRPHSRGCIHLAAKDLMPLFDTLPVGTLVWIRF